MTLIESVRNYILTCPFLEDYKLSVDFLSNEESYTIDPVPSETLIEADILGNETNQFLFVFASREYYGEDALNNMENSGFYEKFSDWIKENNDNGILPVLETGKTATEIQALGLGYLMNNDDSTARYQIQLRMVYEQEGA